MAGERRVSVDASVLANAVACCVHLELRIFFSEED